MERLFVSTPCYDGLCTTQYAQSLVALSREIQFEFDVTMNESLITLARNGAVNRFLKSKCDKLLFIDSDIGFTPEDVAKVVNLGADVSIMMYPKKVVDFNSVHVPSLVDFGAGFMCVKRDALKKMIEAYPNASLRDGTCTLFDTQIVNGEYLSEDKTFVERAKKCGCTVRKLKGDISHIGYLPVC